MLRKMGNFEVIQRTKDGMFNATELLKQWNVYSGMQKEVTKFFELDQTKQFIDVLVKEENLNTQESAYLKQRGRYGATWMHPVLFIKFSMWLNPTFEYHVIKFVHDQLIEYRHLAGDNYTKLCSALSRFKEVDYGELGKMLNYVIFNEHERNIRNKASIQQENDLQQLERDLIRFLEMGFIKSYDQFKDVLRKEWSKRHNKVPVLFN